jgi:imidazolonepropionase-like amidohydrolase
VPDSIGVRLQSGPPVPFAQLVNSVDASRFAAIAQEMKAAGVWSVPTILVWENLYGQAETPEAMGARDEMKYWPRDAVAQYVDRKRDYIAAQRQQWITPELSAQYLTLRRRALRAFANAGAPLLMGTDSPQLFMVPGFSLHHELRIVAEAGLTPFQIYESGSKNVARYVAERLKQPGNFGTVAVGNRADLVLLEANPLESVVNLTRRAGVMVRGRWVSTSEIEAGLAELTARYAQ